jgi:hypothetical protein
VPFFLLFLGLTRAMALFEGRIVELLLGTRMPRRPRAEPPGAGLAERIRFWLKDGRTWLSMLYMLLMLPIGVVYFSVAVTGMATGLALASTPFWAWIGPASENTFVYQGVSYHWWSPAWGIPVAFVVGVLVLVGMMHLIRWVGRGHAVFAKTMLVRLTK